VNHKEKNTDSSLWYWALAAVIALGFLVYFKLYFSQLVLPSFPELGSRGMLFFRILLPDSLVQAWTADGQMPFGFLDRIPLWLAATFWYGLAWWIGDVFIKRLPIVALHAQASSKNWFAVRHPLAITLGLGMLSLTTLFVGLAGFLRPAWGMHLALALWIAIGTASCLKSKGCEIVAKDSPNNSAGEFSGTLSRRFAQLLSIVVAVCCFYYAIAATMAPVEFDVLEYHLQAPKEFWEQGVITFLPHNIYANMPLGIELHSLAWMSIVGGDDGWWWGALIGKVIIGWMAPLTAWLLAASLYEFHRRENGTAFERDNALLVALGGAVLYLTLPGIAEVSQFGQIDAAFGLYLLATAVVAFHFTFGLQNQSRAATVIVMGMLAGFAFAAKYPAVMFAMAPATVVLIAPYRRNKDLKSIALQVAYLGLGILCTAGPWLAKNTILCGNPVYPLAANVFGGKTLDAEKIAQWQNAHAIPTVKDKQGNEVRYSFPQAFSSLQQLAYKSPIPSPIFIPMFVLGTLIYSRRETWWWLTWVVAGVLVWWSMSHRLDRFWLPLLPIACWLAARAVLPLFNTAAGIPMAVVFTIGVTHSLLTFASPPVNDPRYLVSLEAQRHDWKDDGFARVSSVIGWMNENLQATDRVLMVGQAAVFDLETPKDYSTCFDVSKWDVIAELPTPTEQRAKLIELGITHVCIHWGEIERYRSPGNYGFRSKITQPQVAEFISSGVLSIIETGKEFGGVSLLKVNE
jgi:hypothetical protein